MSSLRPPTIGLDALRAPTPAELAAAWTARWITAGAHSGMVGSSALPDLILRDSHGLPANPAAAVHPRLLHRRADA